MRTLFLIFSLTLTLGYSAEILAGDNLLLHCLAKEENQLHKDKSTGPLYHLNQDFLNELASSNDIALKKVYVDEVCSNSKHSPSVALLHLLLMKEGEIFDLAMTEVDPTMRPFKMGYIQEFQKQVPKFFIQYIAGLQAGLATSDCLNNAIPDLKYFNERLKYLEEEMTIHEVMSDKKRIDHIFTKLLDYKNIKKNCEKMAQERVKKKSAPTSPRQ